MKKKSILHIIKMFFLFFLCTLFFFICLRFLQSTYEHYHRYDTPEGPAIQVDRSEN